MLFHLTIPAQDSRYHLRAYVCGHGCVQWQEDLGSATFAAIYSRRPNDCRYAVAESARDHVIVWDLYNVLLDGQGALITPDPVRVCDTVDSAVMATMLLYDEK